MNSKKLIKKFIEAVYNKFIPNRKKEESPMISSGPEIPIDILLDAKQDRVHTEKRKKRLIKVRHLKNNKNRGRG